MKQPPITQYFQRVPNLFARPSAKMKQSLITKFFQPVPHPSTQQSAATVSTDSDYCFPLFLRLPPELRRMIWRLSVPSRVVKINHEILDPEKNKTSRTLTIGNATLTMYRWDLNWHGTRGNVKEAYPTLLAACHESRQLFLELYTSAFPRPKKLPLKWHMDCTKDPYFISAVAKALIPNTQRTTLVQTIRLIERFMNNPSNQHRAQEFRQYASRYAVSAQQISPAFFSTKDDILFLRAPHRFPRFLTGLWSPKGKRKSLKILNLALEFDSMSFWGDYQTGFNSRWVDFTSYKSLSCVQELWVVCLKDEEVLHFTLDTANCLKPGTWAFSCSLDCPQSTQLVEDKMQPVTWHITIATPEGDKKSLWELATTWRPDYSVWELDKRRILRSQPLPEKWRSAIRYRYALPRYARAPVVMPGGDGHTWLGMSKGDPLVLWGQKAIDS